MALLNIEDSFFDDVALFAERASLAQSTATFLALQFLRLSQAQYKRGRVITKSEFDAKFHKAMVGILAEEVDGGFQAIGADKFFGWLRAKVTGGSKGGSAKSEAKREAAKQRELNKRKMKASDSDELSTSSASACALRGSGDPQNTPPKRLKKRAFNSLGTSKAQALPLILKNTDLVIKEDPPSFCSSDTQNEDCGGPRGGPPRAPPKVSKTPGSMVWEAYDVEFRKRYPNKKTPRNAGINAMSATLAKKYGVEEAIEIVRLFMATEKVFYRERGYALEICLKDAQGFYVKTHGSAQQASKNGFQFEFEEDRHV